MDELDHVARVDYRDHLIIELIDDVLADEHGLDIVLHLLGIISDWVHILRDLDNITLLEVLILHHEGVAHGSLGKRVFSDFDVGANLTLLEQWFLPVDVHAYVLCDEPRVAERVVGLGLSQLKVKLFDLQVDELLLVLFDDLILTITLLLLFLTLDDLFLELFLVNHLLLIIFLNDIKLLRSTSLLSGGYDLVA